MILVVLKNTLLIILIVLIIHFMIKNRILDDMDSFKRKLVHVDTLNENTEYPALSKRCLKNKTIDEELMDKRVRFDDDQILKNACEEQVPECLSHLECDDFTRTEKDMPELASKESKMKELYDFVFHEDSTAGSKGLSDFFPENVTDEVNVDKTELDAVISNKFAENKNGHCNFEVIGLIEIENDNDVYGLDTLTSNNFSNL